MDPYPHYTPLVSNPVFKPVVTIRESLDDSNWLPYLYYPIECDQCSKGTGLMYRKWCFFLSSKDSKDLKNYDAFTNGQWLCSQCLNVK